MFTMSSSWIVTTTTLFRLIAVLWPFKARTLINRRFALLSLLVIFGVSLASIMPLYASLIRKVKCTRDMKHKYLAFDMQVTSELMAKAYLPMIQVGFASFLSLIQFFQIFINQKFVNKVLSDRKFYFIMILWEQKQHIKPIMVNWLLDNKIYISNLSYSSWQEER